MATKLVPKFTFPKKVQAIRVVLHAENDLKLLDYVKSIGDIVKPKNITLASRISNNRICIYLSSKEVVDQLCNSHSSIMIGSLKINFRRLISPSKRIIIFNVSPSIPHEIIEAVVKDLGFILTSPISFMKASIPGDEYNHILNFRRQAYIIPPTDSFNLQTSALISDDGLEQCFSTFFGSRTSKICEKIARTGVFL
ncbi:hypothetical protein ABEB36_009365 [Hypothenemus hampei]|uniref:Uncharacterized protein n=1 Tax=Hypothenemus hampei TaxID=57062 RepID=A0ABD1EK96_HYPHA